MLRSEARARAVGELDPHYHEAQTSFLITGVDEWHWTAYCCVDTYFDNDMEPSWYHEENEDPAMGGNGRDTFQPVWNPREYFLIVFSKRMRQATCEWKNITNFLNHELDTYVCDALRLNPCLEDC